MGMPQPHPRLRDTGQHHPCQPRPHPRRRGARALQLQARGPQQQDPPHQPSRLRSSLGRRPHRDDLPLLRRHHHRRSLQMTHTDPRRTGILPGRFQGDERKASAVCTDPQLLEPADIAESLHWAASQPAHLNVDTVELMPVAQSPLRFRCIAIPSRVHQPWRNPSGAGLRDCGHLTIRARQCQRIWARLRRHARRQVHPMQ
jgi:hypothetical protein